MMNFLGTVRAFHQAMRLTRFFAYGAVLLAVLSGLSLEAAPKLTLTSTRTSPTDLEFAILKPDGTAGGTEYISQSTLLKYPLVEVKTDRDGETKKPATYQGIYIKDLLAALAKSPEQNTLCAVCVDKYHSYYTPDYLARVDALLVLKIDGKAWPNWPVNEHGGKLGPYYISQGTFTPKFSTLAFKEMPKIPFGVVRIELLNDAPVKASYQPKRKQNDPQVQQGMTIAINECFSCHNAGAYGGGMAQKPWPVLAIHAATNADYFRKMVTNPQQFKPGVAMPDHKFWDDATFEAVEAYFKATLPPM
jgi:mono/diheme cytochrome c family protein